MSSFRESVKVMSREKLQLRLKELQTRLIKPLTKENVFYHYLPLLGVKSYLELSFNVINPRLTSEIYRRYVHYSRLTNLWIDVNVFRLGFDSDLTTTNTLTAASCLGLYLYNRQTMAGQPLHIRGAHWLVNLRPFRSSYGNFYPTTEPKNKMKGISPIRIYGQTQKE